MTTDTSDLATIISQRLKVRNWNQKQLAHEWHKAVGKKKATSTSTFESRISNLMNDEQDGYAFVDDPAEGADRLGGLARCLDLAPDDLRAAIETAKTRPTIIFGEEVAHERIVYFEKRAARFPARLRCVRPNGESSATTLRERLRDAAKKYRNAFVVVANNRDDEFYAGAGVRTTTIKQVGRGFRIEQVPELSLQQPARTVDSDGMPMFADAALEEKFREKARYSTNDEDKKWIARIAEADADDAPVTFRHDWIMETRHCEKPTAADLERIALSMAAESAGLTMREAHDPWREPRRTLDSRYVWWHGGRVIGFPQVALYRPEIGPVEVHDIESFQPLLDKLAAVLRAMNPYAAEDTSLSVSAEVATFAVESGIKLGLDAQSLRTTLLGGSPSRGDPAKEAVPILRGAEHDARVHKALDEILARSFELPAGRASEIWTLQLLREVPLLHVRIEPDAMEAVANIGTGNILRFTIRRFAAERPTAMRSWRVNNEDAFLDGGDIRISWVQQYDSTLEGTEVNVVARRREEARRAEEEAANDD